MTLKIKLHPRG